jgi:hypothetical protein
MPTLSPQLTGVFVELSGEPVWMETRIGPAPASLKPAGCQSVVFQPPMPGGRQRPDLARHLSCP